MVCSSPAAWVGTRDGPMGGRLQRGSGQINQGRVVAVRDGAFAHGNEIGYHPRGRDTS